MKPTNSFLEMLKVLGACLLFMPVANAEIAADYLIDRPSFNGTTRSSDNLTFNVYDDDACTHLVFTQNKLAGDSSISYEKPTAQKVKGGTAPAKAILIHTVLAFTTPPGPVFLQVSGPGILALGDACQVQVGTGPYRSRYHTSGSLNTTSLNATSSYSQIDEFGTFNKESVGSRIEITMDSRARSGTFGGGANGVQFQIRIDGNPPTQGNVGAITTSDTIDFLSIFSVFEGLAPGSHTVSVWAKAAPAGTSTGVLLDPGGWGGRIIVKETY